MNQNGRVCWLDLEMTGLNAEIDKILEIAALVSDFDNTVIYPGMTAIIHYHETELPAMDTWVKNQHSKSGLLTGVTTSTTDLATVEQIFYDALKPYCIPGKTFLAGNTVYQDRIFLKKYMPKIDSLFHYRIIDVSSIKELICKWYPQDQHREFKKNKEHRALGDIHESMAELSHYRKYFFK
ncbi:MAG: oligoribonuclease [Candidatus Babeliaceae bacterium]|nr:oligoribonuclease [Candidatus Babeliaceae bacterium]